MIFLNALCVPEYFNGIHHNMLRKVSQVKFPEDY